MALHPKMRERAKGSLSLDQVRMILRIYWTDIYLREQKGLRGTYGLRDRLATRFNTTPEIIKKIVSIKHNSRGKRRARYPSISLQRIQVHVKHRLRKTGQIP